ncbi:MAG: response regulator transcription factor [Verrucomicrobia bacterium]|nr:response regulator transcription factor [Verrucomicrobiota bacterium]
MSIKVSIVEDEECVRSVLAMYLRSCGDVWLVSAHETAEEALVSIPRAKPQVVLMDILLPGMDGIECTSRLKAILPDLKIVVLTGVSKEEAVLNAFRAGASGYLLKPFGMSECVSAIREVVSGGAPLAAKAAQFLLNSFRRYDGQPELVKQLTERERQVIDLFRRGYRNRAVAKELNVEVSTIETHAHHIYERLGVHSRTEAIARLSGS